MRAENGWGIGTHRLRSTRPDGWGDYTVEFEIRLAPLADLRPVAPIMVHDIAGGTRERVCMTVVNGGVADAGPFDVALRIMAPSRPAVGPPWMAWARGGAASCASRPTCQTPGQHEIGMVIDGLGLVTEISETNNSLFELTPPSLSLTGCSAGGGRPGQPRGECRPRSWGAPTTVTRPNSHTHLEPGQGRPERDRDPRQRPGTGNGKDDCKAGKNDVAVVVKNGGADKSEKFAVRLTVDGDEAGDKTLDGLVGRPGARGAL